MKIILALLLLAPAGAATSEDLYGTWRLVSFTRTIVATGEVEEPYGKAPRGYLTYECNGRMHAILAKDVRPSKAPGMLTDQDRLELQQSFMAYTGTFSFDGRTAIHRVELASNEAWIGTAQLRYLKLEGRRLIISTPPLDANADGRNAVAVLTWERMTSPDRPPQGQSK
jgi:hypothetical protein